MVKTRQIPPTPHPVLLNLAEALQQVASQTLTSQHLVQIAEGLYWSLMEGEYRSDHTPAANQLREILSDITIQWECLLANFHGQANTQPALPPMFPPEWLDQWLEQTQRLEANTMAQVPKNQPTFNIQQVGNISTGDVTIQRDQVGIQYNNAENPELTEALVEVGQLIVDLQQKYPQATEAQVPVMIDAEFQEIKRTQPKRWQNILNLKRQWNGLKKGLLKVGEHFVEETPWGKGVIGYLEGVTDELDNDEDNGKIHLQ